MLTPHVPLEAAEPKFDAALDDVADAFTSPEYVYLLRLDDAEEITPKANIPTVLFPAADPFTEAVVAEVADPLVQAAYVYLFLTTLKDPFASPRANIPTVELPVAEP